MPVSKEQINIFIAYAKKDEDILLSLRKHLAVLERIENVRIWYDGNIELGTEWAAETDEALSKAKIILLLISADFIASDFCYENQMQKALERHKNGAAVLVPIIIRDCVWEGTPFSKLKVLPLNGVPVSSSVWDTADTPYVEIVKALNKKIDAYQGETPDTPAQKKTRKRGRVLYRIPAKMQKAVTSTCIIRIAPEDLPEAILREDLEDADKAIIEDIRRIGKFMQVQLTDESDGKAFYVDARSTLEQVVEEDDYTEWQYDVTPLLEGRHRLQLKVLVTLVRDEYGKAYKDVVVLDKEIEVVTESVEENYDWETTKEVAPLTEGKTETLSDAKVVEDTRSISFDDVEEAASAEKSAPPEQGAKEEEEIKIKPTKKEKKPKPKPAESSKPKEKPQDPKLPKIGTYKGILSTMLVLLFLVPMLSWAFAPDMVTPVLVSMRYEESKKISDGQIAVKKDGKWGIINKWGVESVAPVYDNIVTYKDTLLQVSKAGKWGLLKQVDNKQRGWKGEVFNPEHEIIIPVVADSINDIREREVELRIGSEQLILPLFSMKDTMQRKVTFNKLPNRMQKELSEVDSLVQIGEIRTARQKLINLNADNDVDTTEVSNVIKLQKGYWLKSNTTKTYKAAAEGKQEEITDLKEKAAHIRAINPKERRSLRDTIME